MLNTLTVQETVRLTMTQQHDFRSLRSLQPCWSTPLVSKNSLVPEVLWSGVRGERTAAVAGQSGYRDAIHRAGQSLGERLLRKLQWKVTGRMLEPRTFLLVAGGAGSDREVAGGIQHEAAALGTWLQAACPRGL